MNSWTNWMELNSNNIRNIPKDAKGVYVIRKKRSIVKNDSDIIYIGQSGRKKQGVGTRLNNLLKDVTSTRNKWKYHAASQKIKKYLKSGLEFSWIKCFKSPDGVEKAMLLAFNYSTGKLPECNDIF